MPWKPTFRGERPTLGYLALDWMIANLARPESQDYEPFVPTKEQAEFVVAYYELDPSTRKRRVRRGVLSRSRGWGKSPMDAGIACFEALGPALCDGWDASGQPVGMPWSEVRKPLVEIAAVSEDQVNTNTWSPLVDMLSRGPVIDNYPGLEPMGGFVNLPFGRIQRRTAEARSAKGAPAHFAVCDQALALDTPIPTPNGWVEMGAIHNGDVIYGSEGPTRVTAAKLPSLEHDCFRVTFEDGTSVVASEGHLWTTKVSASAAAPRLRTTGEMYRDGRRFRIPASPPQEMPEETLPVPPYLLGLWLGDGTRAKCEISVSEADLEDTQRALLEDGVESWPRRYIPSGNQYAGSTPSVNLTFTRARGFGMVNRPEVAKAMQTLPCYRDKHVPEGYFSASIPQRTALLQGLMDSDGSCSRTGTCVFVSTLQVLAEAVVRLLRSLGQVTSGLRWVVDDRYTGGGKWLVTFTPRGGFAPFRLARKAGKVRQHRRGGDWLTIRSIKPVDRVPVRCIAVEASDHLFAAGEGGHLTHNTEEWVSSNGGILLYNTLVNNVTKRGGHLLESPNAFTPGQGSVAESTMNAYRAQLEGRGRLESGLLFDHREAPGDTDLTDKTSLLHGLAVAYGDSADVARCAIHQPPCKRPGWVDLDQILARIWEPDADEQLSRSDWLNQITHASDSWISQPDWAAWRARPEDDPIRVGDVICLGFDGSRGRAKGKPDATALVGCRVRDGRVFQVGVWEADDQPESWASWVPPIVEIEAAIADCFGQYIVVGFYADPGGDWRSFVDSWEATYSGRLKVKATVQHPIEWWMTGGRATAVEAATEQCEGAILAGDLTHDGSLGLTRHVLNARRRLSHGKLALAKESPASSKKIDAAVAMVLAWQCRLQAVAMGLSTDDFFLPYRIR